MTSESRAHDGGRRPDAASRVRKHRSKGPRSPVLALSSLAIIAAPVLGNAAASPLTHSRATTGDYGVLQRFAPQSASTWWAVVASNLKPKTYVVRTSDSGKHWSDVTPPLKFIASSFFLGSQDAWIEKGALHVHTPWG